MHVTRTMFPAGFRKAPSRHPQHCVGTVLSGTLYVGFGDHFNEQEVVAVAVGQSWTVPARNPYFLWAKEGAVLVRVIVNG